MTELILKAYRTVDYPSVSLSDMVGLDEGEAASTFYLYVRSYARITN